MKKQVAIIFGGKSPEYGVSLVSVSAVIQAIDLRTVDIWLIGINHEGSWFHFRGDLERIVSDTWQADCLPVQLDTSGLKGQLLIQGKQWSSQKIDLAFPVMHGAYGEDGRIQGLLEMAGIPYVGCDVMTAALCMDKYLTHRVVASLGIQVTPSISFHLKSEYGLALEDFLSQASFPLFVKPVRAGSSYGISQVSHRHELAEALSLAGKYDQQVMIEQAVAGFEVGCGVMGNQQLIIGGVDEVELTSGFFDFTEKYQLISAKIHCPARISQATRERVRQQAENVYRGLKCRGLARVDFFLQPDGQLLFNEINTMPGFTAHSRFPNLMKEVGWSYEEVVQELLTGEAKDE